jgi:hypothetical protein
MAFTIMTGMAKPGEQLYYEPGFRLIVETCLNQLKQLAVTITDIPVDMLYQYEGNFYGYLVDKGIRPELHWIYLRVNNMEHPNQFGAELRNPLNQLLAPRLIEPNENVIGELRAYYLNRKK